MLTGFAPHRLSVAQQHQASGRNNGSVPASNMIFSHIPTLTDPAHEPLHLLPRVFGNRNIIPLRASPIRIGRKARRSRITMEP